MAELFNDDPRATVMPSKSMANNGGIKVVSESDTLNWIHVHSGSTGYGVVVVDQPKANGPVALFRKGITCDSLKSR